MAASASGSEELSAQEYIERHELGVYLRDVVTLLLRARDERPLHFVCEYFEGVLSGAHVLLREFAYVNGNARNRRAFVRAARDAFGGMPSEREVTAAEMAALLRLLCPDFPSQAVAHAALLCGDAPRHPLGVLLHAACVRLLFAEFLQRTAEVFATCDTRASGVVNRNMLALTLKQVT